MLTNPRGWCVDCAADTSSFAAVGHPAPAGYVYTEKDWASDGREDDPLWNFGPDGELTRPKEENWEAISKVGDLSCKRTMLLHPQALFEARQVS